MPWQYKKNIYRCEKCGFEFVTVDRDHGTTPFQTMCRKPESLGGCDGKAQSLFYRVDQSLEPTHEWYAPDQKEIRSLQFSQSTIEHVKKGGLLLRPIERRKL